MTTRRNLLMGAAALPAIAIAPTVVTEAVAAPAAEAAAVVAEKYPWHWWVSSNGGESYHSQCLSKEEAMQIAEEYGGAMVAECRQQDFDLEVDAWRVLEWLEDSNYERVGDGDFIKASHEQQNDLTRMLTATMWAWVRKHNINTTAWCFEDVREKQGVLVPELAIPESGEKP